MASRRHRGRGQHQANDSTSSTTSSSATAGAPRVAAAAAIPTTALLSGRSSMSIASITAEAARQRALMKLEALELQRMKIIAATELVKLRMLKAKMEREALEAKIAVETATKTVAAASAAAHGTTIENTSSINSPIIIQGGITDSTVVIVNGNQITTHSHGSVSLNGNSIINHGTITNLSMHDSSQAIHHLPPSTVALPSSAVATY